MSMREVAPVGLDSFSAPIGGAAAELKRLSEAAWAEVRAIGRNAVKAESGRSDYESRGSGRCRPAPRSTAISPKIDSSHLMLRQRRSAEDIVPPSPFPVHTESEEDIAALWTGQGA